MLTLYQFAISHYCEKVCWALAYKQLEYRTKNLLPGLHSGTAAKLAGSSSLPILLHDSKAVQNSSTIISYLDEIFLQYPLTPQDDGLKQEALDWEKFADEEIGIPVRLICYNTLLDHPAVLIPLFTENGPWYGRFVLKAIFPKLQATMRRMMNINAETVQAAHTRLDIAVDKIHVRLQEHPFLVGGSFSRADLAVASLLAPLCRPKGYGLTWPQPYPEPLESTIKAYSEKLAWVNNLYTHYR